MFENKCISINSEKPLLLEFTEKGKRIKTGLEIEKLIKNLDIKMKN
ncbi:hypothetical protein T190115A13A_210035 [Tenacibaculum sp. 190524A02b]|uniref:Uncharacterized protein n=1 Tax=Tenacibaculum vairaonense TaxID=3137860 RepID=A0ABM9PL33_9FLAO